MSEYDDQRRKDVNEQREDETPQAHVHVPKWSPWVWVVPVVAIFFVGWLVVRYGLFGGGDITVRFADARGLERYSPVRFRGAKVGTVQKITIDKNLGQVVVRISMDASMNHALHKGTRFWIVEPGLEGGGLGGLLSGTFIGIAPGEGDEVGEFIGQEDAPVLFPAEAGKTFILEARGLGSVPVGSPVQYHGIRVGSILGSEYDAARGVTLVHAFVAKRFVNEVRQGTRFWRGGGLNVSLGGGGLSMGGASLSSLLNAPVAFYTPEVLAGQPVAEKTHFELYESEAMAEAAADGPQLTYLTYFRGPVKGLTAGTRVQMNGVEVGRVRDVRLRYVPESATLETPVTLEIDPRKLELDVTPSTTREELRGRMNDALQKLVQKGMRASLETSLVLPGASAVSLDMTGTPGSARLVLAHDPPIIPAAAGGSGLEGALASVNDVAGRLRNLPIEEIAGHLRSASQKVDALVSDPALHQSLQHLNTSLAEIEKVVVTARENVGPIAHSVRNAATSAEAAAKTVDQNIEPIAKSLRSAADSADSAAKRAEQLMGTSARQNYDLGQLIRELTQAAEAVRALASYLTENPDALLKGRGK
ncbi:MAG: MlaD family protein [Acidobacteriota bacterium]|nr:MlaD family protein [Acidobacteriota bacterium]